MQPGHQIITPPAPVANEPASAPVSLDDVAGKIAENDADYDKGSLA